MLARVNYSFQTVPVFHDMRLLTSVGDRSECIASEPGVGGEIPGLLGTYGTDEHVAAALGTARQNDVLSIE